AGRNDDLASGMANLQRDDQQRREAEERLRRVVDAAPIVLWSNDLHGTFTLSTGRGLSALGLAPGQVVGRSVYELYADFPEILEAERLALAGAEVNRTVTIGEAVFEALFSPLRDSSGAVTGMLGVAFDVSARKRSEAEQERLKAQLLRAQKLESLGLLAGGIAHDFNNILTPILGAAAAAEASLPDDHPVRQDLAIVVNAARRAASLTRQMLAYAGRAQVEVRPIDLSAHVREIAALLGTSVSKRVRLHLDLATQLPAVEADATQVQQVVMNLVINAAEAIGDSEGIVRVTTGQARLDGGPPSPAFLAAEGLTAGMYVFLEVQDSGHGMDEATRQKIFDPFFTTKFTGRGLGLAAVLGIVRAHRGAISVVSSPGRGTTFRVFFPAREGSVSTTQPRVSTTDYRGRGLALIVDDDPGVRRTVQTILQRFGFVVLSAEDGQAGVETFAKHANDVCLVVLDMTMPRMSGAEAFEALRSVRADVPVILTSGYNDVESTRRLTERGLAVFLEKPFTPAELAAKLAAVLPPENGATTHSWPIEPSPREPTGHQQTGLHGRRADD
ncbi:MAG TPA: response regulator, partial [Polyangia bacterium]|nr:response regulator [Polyangia bacterium]